MAKKKSTIVLTTHSMEEAVSVHFFSTTDLCKDKICDKLIIMSEGKILCVGVSADLKKKVWFRMFYMSKRLQIWRGIEVVHSIR